MELFNIPDWRSPIDLALRSGARVSGAMQRGLDGLAETDGLGPFDPLAWMRLATEILLAASGKPVSALSGYPFPKVENSVADVSARPAREPERFTPYFDPTRKPGWGKNPFKPPKPPLTNSAPLPAPPVRPEDLKRLMDQDAIFHFYSIPEKSDVSIAVPDYDDVENRTVIGFHFTEMLHRFHVNVSAPTNRAPLASRHHVGENVGACTWRWMLMPDDYVMTPGGEPPATRLNPTTSQRFAMLDGTFKFGTGKDGFHGTGVGQTTPGIVHGKAQLRVTAVGTISDGFGKFKGRDGGFFVYCGTIDPSGFRGALILRVGDIPGTLLTTSPLIRMQEQNPPEHGITWLTVLGEAVSPVSAPQLESSAKQPGVVMEQTARLLDVDFAAAEDGELRCNRSLRQVVGKITTRMAFAPDAAKGTPEDPLPFAIWREFSFIDALGQPIGGFTTESASGGAVVTDLLGIKGIRMAGTGSVLAGTGRFEGMRAVIAENSVIALNPCTGSSVYLLRVEDPQGQFYADAGVWRDIPAEDVRPVKAPTIRAGNGHV